MLGGAGRSFDGGAGKSGGSPLRDDDAIGARSLGRTNESPEIMRIFNSVENDEKTVFAVTLFQERVDVRVLLAAGNRNDALVGIGVGGTIQLLARQKADLHSAGTAVLDQTLHTLIVPFACDANVLKTARARLESLANRMNAVENDHVLLVYDTVTRTTSKASRDSLAKQAAMVILPESTLGDGMSLSAVIVDDEQLAREELAYLLKDVDVDVIGQSKNGVDGVNLIKELAPDLVFLDVQMPGLDGFGVLKKLIDRKVQLPQIVFATAFDQYAVKAFEVNAVDYLLKPFDKKRVSQAVEKARQKLETAASQTDQIGTLVKMLEQQQKPQAAKVLLKAAGRLFLVDQKDICYAWIEDGIISVVATNMEGQSNCRTLEELLDSLDPNNFWRAHRSYLVNINRIKEVVPWFKSSYQIRMDDKKQTEIPVSRAQTKKLRELFGL